MQDGLFGKSDPYLKIKAIRADGTVEDIADNKTPYKSDDENPTFDELYVSMHELCRGNIDKKIRLECWDYDAGSKDDQIGLVDSTLLEIFSGKELVMIDYKDPPREDKKPGILQLVSGS